MGYTWHHDEEFELVDSELHDLSRYIGGRKIWGGGTSAR
ncbi:HNH endonuclease [Ruminococcus albus]